LVALSSRTSKALFQWKRVSPNPSPTALVFPSESGTALSSRNYLKRVLQPLAMSLNISGRITFQVLRRSYATHNQQHLADLKEQLGHRNLATKSRYVQALPESIYAMAEDFEKSVYQEGSKNKQKQGKGNQGKRIANSKLFSTVLRFREEHSVSD
jgi:integrase